MFKFSELSISKNVHERVVIKSSGSNEYHYIAAGIGGYGNFRGRVRRFKEKVKPNSCSSLMNLSYCSSFQSKSITDTARNTVLISRPTDFISSQKFSNL